MAELAGLPTPRMDWSSSDAPQALKKFKNLCELYFSGPLKDKSEEEQVIYLLIWSGEEGIELVSTWTLTADEKKKLSTYWKKFEDYMYVAPKSNFRLSRYKLCTLKQEPRETVDSFLKKVRLLVNECEYTNPDEHIIDALIFGSNNPRVQSKLLEHDATLTLDKAIRRHCKNSRGDKQSATGYKRQPRHHNKRLETWQKYAGATSTGSPEFKRDQVWKLWELPRLVLTITLPSIWNKMQDLWQVESLE